MEIFESREHIHTCACNPIEPTLEDMPTRTEKLYYRCPAAGCTSGQVQCPVCRGQGFGGKCRMCKGTKTVQCGYCLGKGRIRVTGYHFNGCTSFKRSKDIKEEEIVLL